MQYGQFIGQVQSRARLSSRGEAERAAEATLATLAERLAEGETQHLTAQLPEELPDALEKGRAILLKNSTSMNFSSGLHRRKA